MDETAAETTRPATPKPPTTRTRRVGPQRFSGKDGTIRVQVNTSLAETVHRALRLEAVARETTVTKVVEQAVAAWLTAHGSREAKRVLGT